MAILNSEFFDEVSKKEADELGNPSITAINNYS